MFRQKSVAFSLLAAVLVVVMACTSAPPTPTPVPPTPTPVSVRPILFDPATQTYQFMDALPQAEVVCAVQVVGGIDRFTSLLQKDYADLRLNDQETEAIGACFSSETVRRVMVGQLDREAGGLSEATVICIGEQIDGLSAAALFTEDSGPDSTISLIKSIFCLNGEERAAVSTAEGAGFGFADLGGIDALECVVNRAGPTGLEDLMGAFSSDAADFETLTNLFPIMIECGAIDDSNFEDSGMSAVQVGCLINELGEGGLSLLDPNASEPEMADVILMFAALDACGIDSEGLMGGVTLPLDPNALDDIVIDATVQIESPDDIPDIAEIDLPFTDEQIACLIGEIGEDEITNLLSGGAPDLSLFGALTTCGIDPLSLLSQ